MCYNKVEWVFISLEFSKGILQDMEKKNTIEKKSIYIPPTVHLIRIKGNIITESMIEDPNQGEWDTE